MSTRFIVIAAQAEAASQVSDDFAALVPASTLARVSAAGTSTSEAITSDPEQALPRVVEDIRSHAEDTVLIDALPEGSVSTFDTLGWNLDVAASTNARVIAAFDTEGASPELIEREIEVLERRARQHATRVAAVALPSAVASHVKTQLPILELPFNAQTLDAASALEAPQVVTPLSFQADLIDRARSNRKRLNPKTIVSCAPQPSFLNAELQIWYCSVMLRRSTHALQSLAWMSRQQPSFPSTTPHTQSATPRNSHACAPRRA